MCASLVLLHTDSVKHMCSYQLAESTMMRSYASSSVVRIHIYVHGYMPYILYVYIHRDDDDECDMLPLPSCVCGPLTVTPIDTFPNGKYAVSMCMYASNLE
jgi:hypothetical protein